ncbi:hypothetical protein ACFQVA_00625 [Actinomadura keratinilytica]
MVRWILPISVFGMASASTGIRNAGLTPISRVTLPAISRSAPAGSWPGARRRKSASSSVAADASDRTATAAVKLRTTLGSSSTQASISWL